MRAEATNEVSSVARVAAYNYDDFWRDNDTAAAHTPPNDDAAKSAEHRDQEAALLEVLKPAKGGRRSHVSSIFEAGCGTGRLTRFFRAHFPTAAYEAIDLNADNLAAASRENPDASVDAFSVADIAKYSPTINARYEGDPTFAGFDLVVASEVLMHLPFPAVETAIDNLLSLVNPEGGKLITIDWVPLNGELAKLKHNAGRRRSHGLTDGTDGTGVAAHNFAHDYNKIFGYYGNVLKAVRVHRQVIFVVKP